ncbi:MAG: HNH endonuclease [Clostridia bacterium]|nr:HNH endonuclease [Clostridia bacterium]
MKFELNKWKKQLTDEEILADIQETAKTLGKDYISISTYRSHGKYSQTAIQAHFGTWKNALLQAGLRNERTPAELKLIPDDEYYSDLRRVAKILNLQTVPYDEYKKLGKYSAEHIFNRFGKWSTVLENAGLNPTGFNKDKVSEQECFDEIERMWRLLGRQPTTTDIIKRDICWYSIDTFKRRFGGWRKALEAFVEYINSSDTEYESLKAHVDNESKIIPNEIKKSQDATAPTASNRHYTSRNINARLRFKVLSRDNFKCCACGASPAKDPSVELHVDHIIPWSKGGETVIDNLQTLCSKCNLGKSDVL